MPKLTKTNKSSVNPQKKLSQMTCASCGENKNISSYYLSYNIVHQTGRLPYCKDCLKKMISDEVGNVTLDKLQSTLQLIDRPFIFDLYKISLEDKMDTFGCYMKNLCLKQNRQLTWKDSVFKPQLNFELNYDNTLINDVDINNNSIISDDLIVKWGSGYTDQELIAFERKYQLLKNNYNEKTAMHTEALLNYIRYRVKEEIATAKGDVKEAKEWGGLASNAATAAKINPSQLSKADLSDGLSTFSELSQAVEKEVDIIPILPRFKYRPNDALDFNIWCYVNYIRDLSGLPPCKYEDIYAFYDRRKADYVEQYGDPYGIFSDEPTEKNRDNIKNFIKEEGE